VKLVPSQAASTARVRAGAHVAPLFVPIFKFGSTPSNNRGMLDRMEWQSYNTMLVCRARSRVMAPASAAWYGSKKVLRRKAISAASGADPARYSGSPSKVVVGHSSVVACPGYNDAPDGSRLQSMTVREMAVRITVAPSADAKSYRQLTHQSASLRASQGEMRHDSMSGGISTPVWGMLTMSGASPRMTVSHGKRDSSVIEIE